MEGTDIAIQYSADTKIGRFSVKLVNVHYDEFYQEASGVSLQLIEAAAPGGLLAGLPAPRGFDNLLGINGKPDNKSSVNLSWKHGPYEVFLSGTRIGSFYETAVTDNDYYGSKYARTYRCAIGILGEAGATFDSTVSGEAARVYATGGCGDTWFLDEMITWNLTLGYKFKNGYRIRGQVRNINNERAPLADEYTWGAWSETQSDYGRSYSIELYKKFN
jgi:outer membrane receptor protein involved in Fe transport